MYCDFTHLTALDVHLLLMHILQWDNWNMFIVQIVKHLKSHKFCRRNLSEISWTSLLKKSHLFTFWLLHLTNVHGMVFIFRSIFCTKYKRFSLRFMRRWGLWTKVNLLDSVHSRCPRGQPTFLWIQSVVSETQQRCDTVTMHSTSNALKPSTFVHTWRRYSHCPLFALWYNVLSSTCSTILSWGTCKVLFAMLQQKNRFHTFLSVYWAVYRAHLTHTHNEQKQSFGVSQLWWILTHKEKLN
jgi:hypothetical protein